MKLLKPLLRITGILIFALIVNAASAFTGTTSAAFADTAFFAGSWSGSPNSLDLEPSLTGDLLFGYNNGCVYGEFSHVAMCTEGSYYTSSGTWDGHIVESTNVGTDTGANSVYKTHWQSHFHNYDAASLDFMSKPGYTWNVSAIVSKAQSYSGPYNWKSRFNDLFQWYCSKLVSRAVYDSNGYHLGWTFWGSFISPASVWADSAVIERDHATSSKYDGYSEYPKGVQQTVVQSSFDQPNISPSNLVQSNITQFNFVAKTKSFSYDGATVHTKVLTDDVKKILNERIHAEKAAGKTTSNIDIVLSDAKPVPKSVLTNAKELVKESKSSKSEVEEKWNITDAQLQQSR